MKKILCDVNINIAFRIHTYVRMYARIYYTYALEYNNVIAFVELTKLKGGRGPVLRYSF